MNKKNHLYNTSTVNTSNTNTQSSMMSIHLQRGFKLSSPSCSNTAKRWPSAKPEATGRPGPPSSAAWVDWGLNGLGGFGGCIFGGRTWRRTDLFDLILGGDLFIGYFLVEDLGRSSKIFCVVAFQWRPRSDMTSAHLQGKTPNVGTLERVEDSASVGETSCFLGGKLNRLNPSLLGNGNYPHQNGRNMPFNEIHIFLWSYELTFVGMITSKCNYCNTKFQCTF